MERRFEEELNRLKKQLLEMGAKVERNIGDAILSLNNQDRKLAQDVMGRDAEIDLTEIQIDGLCFYVLALRQPVARDLRFITTALKIVKDLERIGDMSADISEHGLAIMDGPSLSPVQHLSAMGSAAQKMLTSALNAFVDQDVVLARQVIDDDDLVDDHHDQILNELIELMVADKNTITRATHLVYIIKYLERIGDHSSNIAEMVVFMVEGKDIRHLEKLKDYR
ncbi:MAG: phosphate signaling complex protein PhoU [Acidobacteriota bacterium]